MAVWSEVDFGNFVDTFRLDAEFYQPEYLKYAASVAKGDLFGEITTIMHPTEIERIYSEEGIQILLAQNVRANHLSFTTPAFMPFFVEPILRRNKVQVNDVILTRSGANFGDAAVYKGEPADIYACADVLIIRPQGVPGGYLSTYLNTKVGRALLTRGAYGMAQPHIAPNYLYRMHLPRHGAAEQEIDAIIEAAYNNKGSSQSLYAEAETLLLSALGLDKLDLSHQLTYEGSFREVNHARRFDAQYFHPEKAQVLAQIEARPGAPVGSYFESVFDLVDPLKQSGDETAYNYDLTDALRYFLTDDINAVGFDEIGSAKKQFQRGDIVVSRLRSYLKEIALVETPPGIRCVGSSEFYVLRPRSQKVTAELLLVYLRAEPVQCILKWCQDGSQHPRFKEGEILTLNLPDRLLDVQEAVTRLVRQGIEAYQDANRLLDEAKQRVESLILGAA